MELTVLTPEQLKEIWEKAKRILRDGGIRKVELYRDRILSHLKYQISFEENLRIAEGEAREIIRTYKFPPEKPPAKIEKIIREEIRKAFAPPPWASQYPTSWEEIEEAATRIWGEEGRKVVREYKEKMRKKR